MKSLLICTLLAYVTCAHCQELGDIETVSGKSYSKAKVTKVKPNGINIQHEMGLAWIPVSDLPKELQEQFDIQPGEEAEAAKAEAERKAEDARRILAATAHRAEAEKNAMARSKELAKRARPAVIEIVQIVDGGAICKVAWVKSQNVKGTDSFGRTVVKGTKPTVGQYLQDSIYVEGLSGLVDGDEAALNLADSGGAYSYTAISGAGVTLRKYIIVR